MANFRYFFDAPGGVVIELKNPSPYTRVEAEKKFPDMVGKMLGADDYMKGYVWLAWANTPFSGSTFKFELMPVTRKVQYKTQPSRHECDARCTNATGRIMKCECQCGGKNHGRGGLTWLEEGGI